VTAVANSRTMSYQNHVSYLQTQVLSASPLDLVTMLYRAAIEALEAAHRYAAQGDVANRALSANRAANILVELTQSLDRENGGALAKDLVKLYDYVLHSISRGNFLNESAPFEDAIRVLTTLLEAWQSINQQACADIEPSLETHEPVQCSF